MKLTEVQVPGLGVVDSTELLERKVRGMFSDLAKRANDPYVDWNSLRAQLQDSAFLAYLEALAKLQSSNVANQSSNV